LEAVVALGLIAVALGLSNFAAAIGIGLSGLDAGARLRIAVLFGAFEAVMPLVGLALGHRLASSFGAVSARGGGGLLIIVGVFTAAQARRRGTHPAPIGTRLGGLLVTALALSIDNLVVGVALGTHKLSVVVAAAVIAAVSVVMSLIGLELGRRIGDAVGAWGDEISGGVLVAVGIAIALRAL
jgi:putative Mn2+ efflux pump MntP